MLVTLGACTERTEPVESRPPVESGPSEEAQAELPTPSVLPAGARFARAERGVADALKQIGDGELELAAQSLEHAVQLDPMNRQALFVRGQLFIKEGGKANVEAALDEFRQALARSEDVLVHEWLGFGMLALRDECLGAGPTADSAAVAREHAEAARTAFEAAVRLDPQSGNARHNLGYSARLAGKLAESVQVLRALVAEQPERARSLYELGVSLQAQGQPEQARVVLQRLVALQPEHGAARQLLDALAAGSSSGAADTDAPGADPGADG